MAEILNPKVEAVGLVDVFGMAVAKQVTERTLAPFVGNGTLMSGVAKSIAGTVLHGKAGKYGNMVAGGLVVDGFEDLTVALLGKFMSGGQEQTNENNW